MIFNKHANEVNKAFDRSSKIIEVLKRQCEREYFLINLLTLFSECSIALYRLEYSKEDILKRLEFEIDLYQDKQNMKGSK